ncbi:hypothetical protein ACR42D_10535 [Desulfovibrio caledoniensis]
MKRLLPIALAAVLLFAAGTALAEKPTPESVAEVLNKSGQLDLLDRQLSFEIENQCNLFRQRFPDQPERVYDIYRDHITSELRVAAHQLTMDIQNRWVRDFNRDDVDYALTVYDSAPWKKYMALMPTIMRQVQVFTEKWAKEKLPVRLAEIMDDLQRHRIESAKGELQ